MIVYGDPSFEQPLPRLLSRLRQRCAQTHATAEDLRTLLIFSGQVEQAVADAGLSPHQEIIEQVTDLAAAAFLRVRAGKSETTPLIRRADQILSTCPTRPNQPLKVKIPEGYAIYALYPEQYELAARSWLASHEAHHCAVIGIRSIGTSLCAIVAATLKEAGRSVSRSTLRPNGHPFERHADFPPDILQNAQESIIVDEGPGLSGSSMAAVGEALVAAGIGRDRITFFPGHAHGPGQAAPDKTRDWWRSTPQFTAQFLPPFIPPDAQDISGGLWRKTVYGGPKDWPAVCAPFERRKFLHTSSTGERTFFKFTGLAATARHDSSTAAVAKKWAKLADRGWTAPLIAAQDGFISRPWIHGRPLNVSAAHLLPADRLGQYITDAAGPALSEPEQVAAFKRLSLMLQHNITEMFEKTVAIPLPRSVRSLPAAGDGRLGPRDWLLAGSTQVLKADCGGHDLDHTLVGRQPIAWDIAGAIVEWNMDAAAVESLLAACPRISPEWLRFYRLAYAAFRMGQCALCASIAGDAAERLRLERARDFYGNSIKPMLFTHSTQGP